MITRFTRTRKTPLATLLAILALAPFGLTWASAADGEDLVVPEGATMVLDRAVQLRSLDVLGTLVVQLPRDVAIQALRVHVGPNGAIVAPDGLDGADATGVDATGGAGGDGASVVLVAGSLVVAEGGRIEAGNGGRGGHADGLGVVTGGMGGMGGSVLLYARTSDIRGYIVVGSGGAGGNAVQERLPGETVDVSADAMAIGGDGGNTGYTLLNGEPIRNGPRLPPPSQFKQNMDPAVIPACPSFPPPVVGSQGNHGTGGPGGHACMIFFGDDGVQGTGCGNAGTPGQSATAHAIGGNGGHAAGLGSDGGPAGWAWAGARGGRGGGGANCANANQAGGAGSSGGGAQAQATGGQAGDASPAGGTGGLGGCAKAAAKGGLGGFGGNSTHATNKGTGGAGGNGGAAKGTSVGGRGGAGSGNVMDAGGDGGCAFVWSEGGDGGPGGTGSPSGGPGGNGSAITIADATSGEGGAGSPPGDAGDADTFVDPEGGKGGAGATVNDQQGPGGDGGNWIVSAVGANGGTGCNGYPGGAGGDATNTVPPGTGAGGAGNPQGEQGQELLRVEQDGQEGRRGGPECFREILPFGGSVHLALPPSGCEDTPAERADHTYGGPALGIVLLTHFDTNSEDCDGDFDAQDPNDLLESVLRADVNGDTEVHEAFDDDGHADHAIGGAFLLVTSGDGVTFGSIACFGEPGHHPLSGPVTVTDLVLGPTVRFTVQADAVNIANPGVGADCGDFESDRSAVCIGTCVVTFPPGLDGSYHVLVGTLTTPGTQGTIKSP